MLIWKGWGIITPVIIVTAVVLGHLAGGPYGAVAGSVIATVVNWFVGQSLNRPLHEAGLGSGRRHTFFWIPMELWSIAFLVYALFGLAVAAKMIML